MSFGDNSEYDDPSSRVFERMRKSNELVTVIIDVIEVLYKHQAAQQADYSFEFPPSESAVALLPASVRGLFDTTPSIKVTGGFVKPEPTLENPKPEPLTSLFITLATDTQKLTIIRESDEPVESDTFTENGRTDDVRPLKQLELNAFILSLAISQQPDAKMLKALVDNNLLEKDTLLDLLEALRVHAVSGSFEGHYSFGDGNDLEFNQIDHENSFILKTATAHEAVYIQSKTGVGSNLLQVGFGVQVDGVPVEYNPEDEELADYLRMIRREYIDVYGKYEVQTDVVNTADPIAIAEEHADIYYDLRNQIDEIGESTGGSEWDADIARIYELDDLDDQAD